MAQSATERDRVLNLAAGFMEACVIGAAAELDLFSLLAGKPLTAEGVTAALDSDLRATTILLDVLAAMELLAKEGDIYSVPTQLQPFLVEESPQTALPMIRHRMSMLRSWSQLAWVVKAGIPTPKVSSIRGPAADRAAFVAAMHTVSGPIADEIVAKLLPLEFEHLLDVGGASGTWTIAFLRAVPGAQATLFDLPDAIAQARERFAATEFASRVRFAAGDFYVDDLPGGADFAWVSAIAHQHSREHNRALYAKVHAALVPGGRIAIRDIVMEPSRIRPADGAMFAVNMLANTDTGGTFTFDEFAEDLRAAGFVNPALRLNAGDMNSVVVATRP
jgi:hypothetical protein